MTMIADESSSHSQHSKKSSDVHLLLRLAGGLRDNLELSLPQHCCGPSVVDIATNPATNQNNLG